MLEIGKEYLKRLLASRMFAGEDKAEESAKGIARQLVEGYADHGYCIDVDEARRLGLKASLLADSDFDLVWRIHRLAVEKDRLEYEVQKRKMEELLKASQIDGSP